MPDLTRRSLAAGAGLLAGAMVLPAGAQQIPQIASATGPKFRVQPLTFNPERIGALSARMIISHHDNNYGAAVSKLNAITEQLGKLDPAATPAFTINGLKREESIAYNSMVLHELYFECLNDAPTRPGGVFAQAMEREFGSLDQWKAQFAAIAKALSGGSGWVILAYATRDKRLFNHWSADHGMAPAGAVPLLALDMYEHAYHMDFGADAGKYVDTFMRLIRWTTPERLYREAIRV